MKDSESNVMTSDICSDSDGQWCVCAWLVMSVRGDGVVNENGDH